MIRPHRLLLVLIPWVVGAAAFSPPGRAQTPSDGRFMFADTTLLRDTLDLRFDYSLFELADSLGVLPDTLRALAIRHRLSLRRLVFLADSMRMPVDSVGPILLRERFNPLASRGVHETSFIYTTAYDIARNRRNWSNNGEFKIQRGSVFLNNVTNIQIERQDAGGLTIRESRSSETEGGWRFSPSFSLGGRARLDRFDSANPGGLNDEDEDKGEFQVSTRSRLQPTGPWSGDVNVLSGGFSVENQLQVKRGFSANGSGTLRFQRRWLTHDLRANVTGNLARTRTPESTVRADTRDGSTQLDGTLNLFSSAPVGLNVTYGIRRVRVETPLNRDTIQQVRTDDDRLNATLRLRRDNDRYLNVTTRFSRASRANPSQLSSQNEVGNQSVGLQGRYRLLGWHLEGSLDVVNNHTVYPQRALTGGYGDESGSRTFQSLMRRNFGARIVLQADARVSLTQSRTWVIGAYPSPPVDRDQYRQSYKFDVQYTRNERVNSRVGLEVIRFHYINLPSASTGANNETRTYRGEWQWTYRLLPGLTATQRNQLNADYVSYDFLPANNRVSLNFKALTTLNAILNPRLTLEITHDTQTQPSGNYTRFDDGLEYFSRADEGRIHRLLGRFAYSPSPLISLNLTTDYQSNGRSTNTPAGVVPRSESRTLNLSGGGSLNVPIGSRGQLTGNLHRTYRADRAIQFQNGIEQPSGRSELDYWQGRIDLRWEL
jgi:hypothetical protein